MILIANIPYQHNKGHNAGVGVQLISIHVPFPKDAAEGHAVEGDLTQGHQVGYTSQHGPDSLPGRFINIFLDVLMYLLIL